jgi:DegV family protein with EDD domain
MPQVAIVTDSASCVPDELIQQYAIEVAPMVLISEGKAYRDGIDITSQEFYERLSRNNNRWTTSAPSPGTYLELFRKLAGKVSSILVITTSLKFSHSFESAVIGVEAAGEELSNLKIEVLDSGTAAGGLGLVVIAAARAAEQGKPLSDVIASARSTMSKVNLIAFLDTLYYLARGGRVPQIAALATSLLDIKPVIELLPLSQGIRSLQKVRTRLNAVNKLEKIVKERVKRSPVHCIVMHSNVIDEAEELKKHLAGELDCVEIYVADFTPVMGVHTGPGLLGVAFYVESG